MRGKSKLLKQLAEEKRRNANDNLKFVILRAEWLKRTSNREWSRRRKLLVDSIYKTNRKPKPQTA